MKFSELIGQPHIVRTLLNGLRQGRVAHAYMFSGPRGVGKTTTARLLVKAINCSDLTDGEPCGKCPSCQAIGEGRAIDVLEIDAASNRGIEEIRQLRDGVRYAPIDGKAKTYIIDEVHMLTTEAFNALLKTLEEPPAHAYFCLATTASQKVPATILSRCQRFDFRRVSAAEIRSHLERICAKDGFQFEIEGLDIIARRADGSVRDGLSILDQVIAFSGGRVLKQDTIDVLGEVRLDLYFRAVDLVSSGSPADAFVLDEDLSSTGTDPQDFVFGLQTHIMHIVHFKTMGAEKVDLPREYIDEFKRVAGNLSEGDLIRLLQLASVAETDIRRNFNPRHRLQLLLLKFVTFERSVVLSDLIDRLSGSKKVPSSGSTGSKPRIQQQSASAPSDRIQSKPEKTVKSAIPEQQNILNQDKSPGVKPVTDAEKPENLKTEEPQQDAGGTEGTLSDDPVSKLLKDKLDAKPLN